LLSAAAGTFFSAISLSAAPKLRISTASIGPVTVISGQDGPTQTVQAGNPGDGDLALQVSANSPWIAVSLGSASPCGQFRMCTPVQIALKTASLTKGSYTGLVTLTSAKAAESPQTITVTVKVSGGVPDALDLYLPPNSMTSATFTTANSLTTAVNNPQGGPVLSIAAVGGGSFAYTYSYQVTAIVPPGTAESDYKGTIALASSAPAANVKNMPVTVHVTSAPIASFSNVDLELHAAQGSAKVETTVDLSNIGQGTLTVSGATVSGGAWLTAKAAGNKIVLWADPTGLKPGLYQATLSVASNAKNTLSLVPVGLEVRAAPASARPSP